MKTYARYKVIGGEVRITGEVVRDEDNACYLGILYLELGSGEVMVLQNSDVEDKHLDEAWRILNEKADETIKHGFQLKELYFMSKPGAQ